MQSETDLKKMLWHSRRGMLELDLLLIPFAKNSLAKLSCLEKNQYKRLLLEEDQDLYTWLIGKSEPEDNDLKNIISIVKNS